MSQPKKVLPAVRGLVLFGALVTACSDQPRLPTGTAPLAVTTTASPCAPGTRCNIALNPSRSGFPSPLSSDPGWGGGSDTWDIVDGQSDYAWWAEGLALHYGGQRQITIDFGAAFRFDEVVVWHHTDCCAAGHNIPASVSLEYFDGSAWHPIPTFSRSYDLTFTPPPGQHGSHPDRYTFAPVTGSRVRWSYNGSGQNVLGGTGGWHGWVYEFEVFGQQSAGEFEINLTTFIPGNNLKSIAPWHYLACGHSGGAGMYFEGDTRGFDPNATSFRTRQTVTVVPDGTLDPDGLKDGTSPANLTGTTRAYAPDALPILDAADDDGILGDCTLLHDVGQASTGAMSVAVTRTGSWSVRVRLAGSAANPLVAAAPAIDWDLMLDLDVGAGTPQWQLTGLEDGFPAFELYVNGTPIYQRNAPPPYSTGDLNKLRPHAGDVRVNRSGTL
ncbi:MAG TPA: DUF3238 domain-containing protein [Longimicrobiaceae bacterium]|nr:DUF3238 domain-containing protein [Longimicrobiaceae bacterium]